MTIHIWPYNWGWARAESLAEDLPGAFEKTDDYVRQHLELAGKYGQPVVGGELQRESMGIESARGGEGDLSVGGSTHECGSAQDEKLYVLSGVHRRDGVWRVANCGT